MADIYQVWDDANPHSWNKIHTGSSVNDVSVRMNTAAIAHGLWGDYQPVSTAHGCHL